MGELIIATIHVLGWSVYVGGALIMEFVWRPTQEGMPMSQIGVACQWMGRRYRWLSAAALAAIGASGAALAWIGDGPLTPGSTRGLLIWSAVALWVIQCAVLGILSFMAHPGLHQRMPAVLDDDARAAARARTARAITRMDRLLRLELVLAVGGLALGSALRVWS